MIYIVNSCRWKKIKQKDNIVETSNLIDTDIVYIGENVTKCVEYVEEESNKSNKYTTFHIIGINFSRCQYMTFRTGLSNHTHLEKFICYNGNTMIRHFGENNEVMLFNSDFEPMLDLKEPVQKFRIIHHRKE